MPVSYPTFRPGHLFWINELVFRNFPPGAVARLGPSKNFLHSGKGANPHPSDAIDPHSFMFRCFVVDPSWNLKTCMTAGTGINDHESTHKLLINSPTLMNRELLALLRFTSIDICPSLSDGGTTYLASCPGTLGSVNSNLRYSRTFLTVSVSPGHYALWKVSISQQLHVLFCFLASYVHTNSTNYVNDLQRKTGKHDKEEWTQQQ